MSIIQGNAHTSAGGYQIERSLRFNSADSAYLNRTPASASNRKTWTWSGWVKRSALGAQQSLFTADNQSGFESARIHFLSGDTLSFQDYQGTQYVATTTAVFRDPSAWYHIVVALDTTQATAANRLFIYVNGVSQAYAWGTTIAQNTDGVINTTKPHFVGRRVTTSGGAGDYYNGYMTEVNFIDGQALTPSSFGETDSATGVWKPKAFSGTYGTNGFYLKFADNSGTTSTTLGKDSSGNGNNWTPNNFSVTAGAGNDSLVDSPTSYGTDTGAGGEVRGNYCTLNPTDSSGGTISNGNLDVVTLTTGSGTTRGTIGISSGKWYWEGVITAGTGGMQIGIVATNVALPTYTGFTASGYAYSNAGNKENNSTSTAYGASYTTNDVIGVALDMDAGTLVFYKNGASQGTAFSSLSGTFAPGVSDNSSTLSSTIVLNFGQRAFAYTAPSGFKALCTQNLPTPTIGATSTTQADDYFDAVLWSGDSSLSRNITGWDFNLDFLWVKQRNTARDHWLVDRVRGVQKGVVSNSTAAESTDATATNAFVDGSGANASGFTAGNGSAVWAGVNGSGNTYVGWGWKANGAGSSNTAGTITSTVSANTTSGFSIVTYTGTGSNATVGHGLGVAPRMVIAKSRTDGTAQWLVYHGSLANTQALYLNGTNSAASSGLFWNSTSPTSTVFSIGTSSDINVNTQNYVAYCFAPVAGYSAFGSYTGNGSTDGPFVYLGFRPRYVMYKRTDTTGNWIVYDTARNTYNVTDTRLSPNLADAEVAASTSRSMDILSNGFKLTGASVDTNASGGTYIYAAFAETPAKFSLAR